MVSQVLRDCVVALSGTFQSNHSELSSDIKSHGGKHSNKVTKACTHLVASQDHYDSISVKNVTDSRATLTDCYRQILVKQAKEHSDIQIVNIDWLMRSFKADARADESSYLLTNSDSQAKGDAEAEEDHEAGSNSQAEKEATKKADKGKKRTRHSDLDESTSLDPKSQGQPPAKKIRDGQKAKSSTLRVPVDEGCNLAGAYLVYIDDDDIIYDAALNQTNIGGNNNKFYRIQLLKSVNGDKWYTWTRWGRVGEHGQKKILGTGSFADATKEFDKKFKDKSGHKWDDRREPPKKGKYTYIERNYEEDSSDGDELPGANGRRASKASYKSEEGNSTKPVESALPKPVQRLMEFIFNQNNFASAMAEMSYDANKLPLGKLGKRTLVAGFERLKELGEIISDPALANEKHNMTWAQAIEAITNSYYSTIPHAFGRNRPPMIRDEHMLKKEIELIESLGDMEIANEIMKDANKKCEGDAMHHLDRQFAGLGLTEMTPLSSTSHEYKNLNDYLVKTHGHTHHMQMKVQDIFRIERNGEFDRFNKSPYAKIPSGDRRLLWHGSRSTNFGGILSQGLRIAPPEAPVNGYMFGKGVYLADISSKSANYCVPYASGNVGLLLLCEAELGKPVYEPDDAEYDAAEKAKEKGCYSTWGKGSITPKAWKDARCVHEGLKGVSMPDTTTPPVNSGYATAFLEYNEYIAYDIAQIRLRYLLRVDME